MAWFSWLLSTAITWGSARCCLVTLPSPGGVVPCRARCRYGSLLLAAGTLWKHGQQHPASSKLLFLILIHLLDEFHKPFWCVSSPISMVSGQIPVHYDYDGDPFFAWYSGGKVEMQLAWMEKQFSLVSLVVFVPVGKVNRHFGRDY